MGYGLWVMGCGLWVMGYGLWVMGCGLWVMGCLNARRMNQNQRYECRMAFPGYEGSPYGIPRGEYAANQDFRD